MIAAANQYEDEFAEAVRRGVVDREEAEAVRAQDELLARQIDELLPTGWEHWRPVTGWPPLVLPSGWETVE